jgi:hypothetical protein
VSRGLTETILLTMHRIFILLLGASRLSTKNCFASLVLDLQHAAWHESSPCSGARRAAHFNDTTKFKYHYRSREHMRWCSIRCLDCAIPRQNPKTWFSFFDLPLCFYRLHLMEICLKLFGSSRLLGWVGSLALSSPVTTPCIGRTTLALRGRLLTTNYLILHSRPLIIARACVQGLLAWFQVLTHPRCLLLATVDCCGSSRATPTPTT